MEFEIEQKFIELECMYKTLHNALTFCADNSEDSSHLVFLADIIAEKLDAFPDLTPNPCQVRNDIN